MFNDGEACYGLCAHTKLSSAHQIWCAFTFTGRTLLAFDKIVVLSALEILSNSLDTLQLQFASND